MSDSQHTDPGHLSRRQFFGKVTRTALGATLAGAAGSALVKESQDDAMAQAAAPRRLWQIDPLKCIQCGRCRTNCVLDESAVKCVHDFSMCGYCDLCTGFFRPDPNALTEGAENQLCPVGAIIRRFVQDEFFEYHIDQSLCTGCAICVRGCTRFGNGSLYLQVMHDRCVGCNECNIAAHCPAGAFIRVPADEPYLVKHEWIARQDRQHTARFQPPELDEPIPTFREGLEGSGG